ncbi:MAG: YlbF family regulator [Caloramator sp.]|uniref:YlbF family regulator n=1 Tax=unclassified Caloramator TaxID=2629145 RepID=UPI00040CC839|nr:MULTISPECIES: YlbF family regulator [unclassified Caloramator]MBZ4662440.1 YlbF family regulator [Caloramator sp.]
MNIYDKAHELARLLKNSPEVIEYKKMMEKIKENEENKKIIEDLRKKEFEVYSKQLQGIQITKEEMEAINNLYGIIQHNSVIREYLEAERRFSIMWQDIIKILGEAVDIDFNNI